MKKSLPILITILIPGLLLLALLLLPGGQAVAGHPSTQPGAQSILADPVTVITVTSGTDPDDSASKTCYTDPYGPPGPPTSPCTLRRAIVEASALDVSARPILIKFEIPAEESEGYVPALGIWKIQIYNTTDTVVLGRLKDGQVTIDGSTQPNGRTDGPKIIIVGPSTGNKDGLVVGDIQTDNYNIIRGLGFQNLRTHLFVNSYYNIIEDNWFGLNDDGTAPVLRIDDPENGSGVAGIAIQDGANYNTIQNNVFLGLDGVATAIRGDFNTFSGNYVGTRSDGTVTEKQTDPDLVCTTVDWLGGGGISVSGNDHTIQDNIFAGLRQEIFEISQQPDAIRVEGGDGDQVLDNLIGVDADDTYIGVCGRAIYLSDGPEGMLVSGNTIVDSRMSAISLNGYFYDANTLRSNSIYKTSEWPQVEGNPKPEDAIQLGTSLKDTFEFFKPAKVTSIDGVNVSGTSGNNSLCEECVIEIFLDDTDVITEALQALVVVTADTAGNWTAVLPFELEDGYGLRTTSTSPQYNTIPGMSAGTTTGLSDLYLPEPEGYFTYLSFVVK